jgi:hypothetical protein
MKIFKKGNVSTVPVQTVFSLSMLAEFRLGWSTVDECLERLHCKKVINFPILSWDVSKSKLSLTGNN